MKKLTVGLEDRAYPIYIKSGLLHDIGVDLHKKNIAKRYGIIADDNVASLFGEQLLASCAAAGVATELMTFPHGEQNKNLATVGRLASMLAQHNFDRKDGLVALGGGVTGDITGFLAASYMRGIPFVQVPTTLLAQVDSSVGGKTGVDIPEGKNLVGAFYQPRAVYIDSTVLRVLPKAELLNGLAEIIKYGVIYDAALFSFLKEHVTDILALDLAVLEDVIQTCCRIKAEVVAADERESDLRRILNFGHTIGHAVEAASDYQLAHGSAVAMGMIAAGEIAMAKQMFSRADAESVKALIAGFGLPVAIPTEYDKQRIKGYLKTDKKAVGGRPFFVLPTSIGKVIITDEVDENHIDKVL